MQQEVLEMWRKNEDFKTLACSRRPRAACEEIHNQVTKTADFHFLTDERIKQHPKNQEEYKEVNFMSELPKHPSTPARETRGCTIIKPFHLSKGKKRTFDEAASPWRQTREVLTKPRYGSTCWRKNRSSRRKQLASKLVQTPSSFKRPLFPRKRKISVAENPSGSLVQEPFQLATEKRAKEQQELEKKMAEMEAFKLQQLEEVWQQEEEQQKEELASLRRNWCTRQIQALGSGGEISNLPLTVSVSPKFSTRFQ